VAQEGRAGTTIVGLVAAGMKFSLLPDTYERIRVDGVLYKQLELRAADCPLLLAYRKEDLTDLMQRFVELATAMANARL